MVYEHNPVLPIPEDVIPHRPPHLFLSGVTELTEDGAKGFWLPGKEHFAGHFPGMPLLPGVYQVESVAQLGAYAAMAKSEEPILGLFKGIESTHFERVVKPGDFLELAVEIIDRNKRDFKGKGIVEVSGQLACETTIIGALLPERVAKRMLS